MGYFTRPGSSLDTQNTMTGVQAHNNQSAVALLAVVTQPMRRGLRIAQQQHRVASQKLPHLLDLQRFNKSC